MNYREIAELLVDHAHRPIDSLPDLLLKQLQAALELNRQMFVNLADVPTVRDALSWLDPYQ